MLRYKLGTLRRKVRRVHLSHCCSEDKHALIDAQLWAGVTLFCCRKLNLCSFKLFVFADESVRSACAYTLQAIGQHNQDVLKEHSSVVIPLVFFAMHANKIPGKSCFWLCYR